MQVELGRAAHIVGTAVGKIVHPVPVHVAVDPGQRAKLQRAWDQLWALDADTAAHSLRVNRLAYAIATRMHVSSDVLWEVDVGTLLHDLGKLDIRRSVLRKPGPLDEPEWVEMKTHPNRGLERLSRLAGLERAGGVVLSHHEQVDGRGYPQGLRGDEIPLAARIAAVADVWDALVSWRPYKKPLAQSRAREILEAGRGTRFDPAVLNAFFSLQDARRARRADATALRLGDAFSPA